MARTTGLGATAEVDENSEVAPKVPPPRSSVVVMLLTSPALPDTVIANCSVPAPLDVTVVAPRKTPPAPNPVGSAPLGFENASIR